MTPCFLVCRLDMQNISEPGLPFHPRHFSTVVMNAHEKKEKKALESKLFRLARCLLWVIKYKEKRREGPLAVVIVDVTGLVDEERQKERPVRVRSARANERCLVPRRPYRVELCQGKNGESACTLLIRLCPAEKRKKGSLLPHWMVRSKKEKEGKWTKTDV